MAKNRSVAEDLLEEPWLRLVSSAEDLRSDTRLGPWLFYCRPKPLCQLVSVSCPGGCLYRRFSSSMAGRTAPNAVDVASLNEFEERLEAAIAYLPPIYREAILLVGVEQLRPVDVAKVCGVSADSLRQRLKRARELISRFITDQDSSTETGRKELSHVTKR